MNNTNEPFAAETIPALLAAATAPLALLTAGGEVAGANAAFRAMTGAGPGPLALSGLVDADTAARLMALDPDSPAELRPAGSARAWRVSAVVPGGLRLIELDEPWTVRRMLICAKANAKPSGPREMLIDFLRRCGAG